MAPVKTAEVSNMAPVKRKVFTFREKDCCKKNFIDKSNIDINEKRFHRKPLKRRHIQHLFDEVKSKYCATPGCSTKSKFKGNVVRHMKDCLTEIAKRTKS